MTQCLLPKHEDLRWDPENPCKNWARHHMSVTLILGSRNQQVLGTLWLGGVTQMVNALSMRDLVSYNSDSMGLGVKRPFHRHPLRPSEDTDAFLL